MPSTDISAGRDCGLRRKLGILATMYFEKTYFDKDCGSKGFLSFGHRHHARSRSLKNSPQSAIRNPQSLYLSPNKIE
jgi:hypothetical protein